MEIFIRGIHHNVRDSELTLKLGEALTRIEGTTPKFDVRRHFNRHRKWISGSDRTGSLTLLDPGVGRRFLTWCGGSSPRIPISCGAGAYVFRGWQDQPPKAGDRCARGWHLCISRGRRITRRGLLDGTSRMVPFACGSGWRLDSSFPARWGEHHHKTSIFCLSL